MKIFDPAAHPELKELFPELTPIQFETCLLFAFGHSQKDISLMRCVNYSVVTQSISESRAKFEPHSLTGLRSVFLLRLACFVYECIYHK